MLVRYNEKHPPRIYKDILGCSGYYQKSLICFFANGDNNFVDDGIVENSLLFIDTEKSFDEKKINVFQLSDHRLKLSKKTINSSKYIGRVISVINQYE